MAAPTDPNVRVVVLNWNSAWYTRRCLEALGSTDYPSDRFEVVLVDNGSVDGSLERLADWFPDVRIVANGRNLGFAEGCNRAMRDRDGVDAIALINNDAVVDPGWLRPLVSAFRADPTIGAASARLVLEPGFVPVDVRTDGEVTLRSARSDSDDVTAALRYDGFEAISDASWPLDVTHRLRCGRGRIWVPAGDDVSAVTFAFGGRGTVSVEHGGDRVDGPVGGELSLRVTAERVRLLNGIGTARNDRCEGYDRHYGEPVDAVAESGGAVLDVPGVCGGAALLRSSMLDEVGLFDPSLFAYYEDTDLSWRASRAGWRVVAVPASSVAHAFGASGGSRALGFFHLDRRNWWLTADRNGTAEQRRVVRSEVRRDIRRALRANLAGRLRHRRVPSFVLLRAWAGIVADHRVVSWRRVRAGATPPGAEATDAVTGRFQPSPAPRLTPPRPWGPVPVRIEVAALVADGRVPVPGWDPARLDAGRSLVRALLQDDPRIDPSAVVVGEGGDRLARPSEIAAILGAEAIGPPPADDPIRIADGAEPVVRLVPGGRGVSVVHGTPLVLEVGTDAGADRVVEALVGLGAPTRSVGGALSG